MTEVRVKIENPAHIFSVGNAAGMMGAMRLLEELPAELRKTPGIALAIATVSAEANAIRADIIGKNLAAVARAGHNVAEHREIYFDPNEGELVCTFYED